MDDIPALPRPKLEVRDLQVVLALASAGSTARAAAQLHLTQPAVSRALLAIEDKLGTALFERSQRGLQPTAAGTRLLGGAREWLVGLQELERRTCVVQAPARLRLVCECYTAYHWLPSALMALRRTMPELAVTIEMAHTAAPVAALENDAVDVALLTTARLPRHPSVRLVERDLFSDEVVFVVGQKHALAAAPTLTRADLRRTLLLCSSHTPSAESEWFLRAAFGKRAPKLQFQPLPLTEAILDAARAGLGIAVLSEWIAAPHLNKGDLLMRRLDSGPLRRPWRFVHRSEVSEPAQRLFDMLAISSKT